MIDILLGVLGFGVLIVLTVPLTVLTMPVVITVVADMGRVRLTLGLLDDVLRIPIPVQRSKKQRPPKKPKREKKKRDVPSILKRAVKDKARRGRLLALLWKMVRGVHFQHGHVHIVFGFEDPAATGEALGIVQAILGAIPLLRRFLTVTGEFSGRALERASAALGILWSW